MSGAADHEDPAGFADMAEDALRAADGISAYEIRADERRERTLALKGRALNASRLVTSRGVGMEIHAGGGRAYVHLTAPTREQLGELVARGIRLARHNARNLWRAAPAELGAARRASYAPSVKIDPMLATNDELVEVMRAAADAGAALDAAMDAQAAFGARSARTLIRASNGTRVQLESLVSTLRVLAVLAQEGKPATGAARLAGERGLEDYAEAAPEVGAEAARRAKESAQAAPLRSGRYRVLCDNELSGTLAHESFGHLTEHDLVSSGWSTLQGRLGERLAASVVSVTDGPVSPKDPKQGVAVRYDDQGFAGKPVTMLRDGVLEAWMHTRDSAAEAGQAAAGNGRALDSRFPPIVRMRNTYFEPGDATLDEGLAALGDGLYLIGARGGAPHSDGSFMFTAIRGYVVEKGQIARPLRTAAIHGNVFDFLQNVEMLTRDFEVTTNFFGGCGKREQSFMHVGVGGPHVLVRDALVGGA